MKGKPRAINEVVFQVYAAVTWGAVMWLFREERERLQAGMSNSMQVSGLFLGFVFWFEGRGRGGKGGKGEGGGVWRGKVEGTNRELGLRIAGELRDGRALCGSV